MRPDLLIQNARREAKLTQAQLAERLGRSQAAIAGLERSDANPTVKTLERTLRATGHGLKLEAVERPSSVDDTLIASYLRMSPAQRLRAFRSSHESLSRLRRLAQGESVGRPA
jgi:transcriptional regulator with XRE-family HTH domain